VMAAVKATGVEGGEGLFTKGCAAFGKAAPDAVPTKAVALVGFFKDKLGEAFVAANTRDIAKLLPDEAKRTALLEAAGMGAGAFVPQVGWTTTLPQMLKFYAVNQPEKTEPEIAKLMMEWEEEKLLTGLAMKYGDDPRRYPADGSDPPPIAAEIVCADAADGILTKPSYLTAPKDLSSDIADQEAARNALLARFAERGEQVFEGLDAELSMISRCKTYCTGLMAGTPGQYVTAWPVLSVNEWNRKQERVLVLGTDQIFRVNFDKKANKVGKVATTSFAEMLAVVKHEKEIDRLKTFSSGADGSKNMKQMLSPTVARRGSGGAGPMSPGSPQIVAPANVAMKSYSAIAPRGGATNHQPRDVMEGILEAITAVHELHAGINGTTAWAQYE